MGKLLDKLSKKLTATGYAQGSYSASQWLRKEIPKLGNVSRGALIKDPRGTTNPSLGNMFFFFYDAKLKKELPYWDRFPVVLVIDLYDDGFLGLNFHYLPVRVRVALLDALLETANNDKMDQTTRMTATYSMLKGVARYEAFAPCIKRYLASHVQSQMLPIPANQWEMACMLPVEKFEKASSQKVWRDSMKSI